MSRFVSILFLISALSWTAAKIGPSRAYGQTALREDFESPTISWRDNGGDVKYQIETHQRTQQGAHGGAGCEFLRLNAGGNGTQVLLAHEIGQPLIIAELQPSVWVRSDRAGVQLICRVVLPRVRDPRTGDPRTLLIRGSSYSRVGYWDKLRFDELPAMVSREARGLQASLKTEIDVRESFIDRLMLNVYGGAGVTQVWIDDLEIAGFVGQRAVAQEIAPTAGRGEVRPVSGGFGQPNMGLGGKRPARPKVELSGAVLLVDGRPFFPRMIEYRGESLQFLQALGFNTVRMAGPPTPELLEQAAQLSLWLVCPPPLPSDLGPATAAEPSQQIDPAFDPVLIWDLGQGLTSRELERSRRWADSLRQRDPHGRPIACDADAELKSYSRLVDVLFTHRFPLGTSFELADYATWLLERPRLARPGSPQWTVIQTQPAAELREQSQLLSSGRPAPPCLTATDQTRLLTYAALSVGIRGLCFQSQSPLDAQDPETRARAMNMELLNLELEWIEPWIAAGNALAAVPGSDPDVNGGVLQNDRGRLLLPLWTGRGSQYVPGQSAGNGVSLVVPGVPESINAWEVSPGGLRPLVPHRVTGGVRVTLGEFGLTAMVLLTQDPLAMSYMTQRLGTTGRRAVQLQRDLAAWRLSEVEKTDRKLKEMSHTLKLGPGWLASARTSLQATDQQLAGSDTYAAWQNAGRITRPLRMIERNHFDEATKGLGSPVTSPHTVGFATLPDHWDLIVRSSSWQLPRNELAEGRMDDLQRMLGAGWRNFEHPLNGVVATTELSTDAPHRGRYCLRLAAGGVDQATVPGLIETPPVWITTPPMNVESGEVVRIHGFIRVRRAIVGSLDGVMIVDSLSGEPGALRFGVQYLIRAPVVVRNSSSPPPSATPTTNSMKKKQGQPSAPMAAKTPLIQAQHMNQGWQEFTLYRAAPQAGQLTVTVALTGLGECWLDDVTIERMVRASSGPALIAPTTSSRVFPLPAVR
jgi:hypothetical protein